MLTCQFGFLLDPVIVWEGERGVIEGGVLKGCVWK